MSTWDDYHRAVSLVMAEMIGAANHFDEDPDYATDAVVAEAFRCYVERARAIERPGVMV